MMSIKLYYFIMEVTELTVTAETCSPGVGLGGV